MPPSGPILNEKLWHFHRTALLDYLFHQLGPLCLRYLHQPRLHHRGNGRRLQDGDEDGDGGLSGSGEFPGQGGLCHCYAPQISSCGSNSPQVI